MLGFLWNFRLRNPFLSDRSNSRSISGFFFSQRGRPRRNMRFNSKRRVNRRHLSTGNKIYCMFAIQFNEIRLVPLQSRRERRSLNTVKSLSDKKGILAHKMCRRVYNKIWGFLVQVAVFQYTHKDL